MNKIDLDNLHIVKYPNQVLQGPCPKIVEFGPELAELAARMFEFMYASRGVGLAGPQIGVQLQIFVANPAGQKGQGQEKVYINPVVLEVAGEQTDEEGCLSLPGVNCKMKRAMTVRLRAQDLQGQEFEETGTGLLARIFQHETDHLNGVLLSNRMSALAKLANRRRLKELQEGKE